jgi:hypothetical protein
VYPGPFVCPICKVKYLASEEYEGHQIGKYLSDAGFGIKFKDTFAHCRQLALIARNIRSYLEKPVGTYGVAPMAGLFEALNSAQSHVHFVTYGISLMLLGALKITSHRVPVRGIVSGVEAKYLDELTNYKDEAPNLKLNIFDRSSWNGGLDNAPHQKLIVIDGLMAFAGSANLTVSGWRKAIQGRDVIDIVTDVDEVVRLHNRFFSPVWLEFQNCDNDYLMMDELPF